VRGPKPPQSATTKTPRSLFHERPATLLDPSLCLNAHAHVRPITRPRLRPLRTATRCGRKRDDAREAYLSATSSAGPAGEMKLDHLYWVAPSRRRRSVFDDGNRDTSSCAARLAARRLKRRACRIFVAFDIL